MMQFCSKILCCCCCARVQIENKNRRYIEQALDALADILHKPTSRDFIHNAIQNMKPCQTFYDTMALVRNAVIYLADFHQIQPDMLISPSTSPLIKKHVSDSIGSIQLITSSGIVDQTAILHYFIWQANHHCKKSLLTNSTIQDQLITAALHIILHNSECTLWDLLRIHRDMLPKPIASPPSPPPPSLDSDELPAPMACETPNVGEPSLRDLSTGDLGLHGAKAEHAYRFV